MQCMERSTRNLVTIWPGVLPGYVDPTTHFWYAGLEGSRLRLCDDAQWLEGTKVDDSSRPYVPCSACQELYVEDVAFGLRWLDPQIMPTHTPNYRVYDPLNGGCIDGEGVSAMASDQIKWIPMAAFARFYEATGPQKVRMVRDARIMVSDPRGYRSRDYYFELRNTLRQTHWRTNDIATFEAALGPLISDQLNDGKKDHYRKIGESYIKYWRNREATFFDVPPSFVEIAGLNIRISVEAGMNYHGDRLALKIWWNAPRPTRSFRQAIQHLTERGRGDWYQEWQSGFWDVRREEVLPPVPMPRDFALAIEGQAMAFQQIWRSLGE